MRKKVLNMDFSPTGLARVYLVTILGTLGCIAVTFFVDSFQFPELSPDKLRRAIILDTLLPLGLAAPLLFILMSKIRLLNIAKLELSVLATTDSLTAVLNRGAFAMLVEAYLESARNAEAPTDGALLIVDADNFKRINDRYGHGAGDDALKLIANTIRDTLRPADLLGRIGGEEFGIFLPGYKLPNVRAVAERIRQRVDAIKFVPAGRPHALSVSIGGATLAEATTYDGLFQVADRRLYGAKQDGRNRVCLDLLIRPEPLGVPLKTSLA